MRKKKQQSIFENLYSPYETSEKKNMDSWYKAYQCDPERTYKKDGFAFSKIIYRCDFQLEDDFGKLVSIEPQERIKVGNVLMDETGNEFVVKSFEMLCFRGEIPEWYPRMMPMLIVGASPDIGRYLTLKQNTTLKEAYTKAKKTYKRFMGGTCTFDYALEGDSWWFFSFYNFFLEPKELHGQLFPREAGGKNGYRELLYGSLRGVQIFKKDATIRLFGTAQNDEYLELRKTGKVLSEDEAFSFRQSRKTHTTKKGK